MARPKKSGLDYYNSDTDRYQDIKVKRLKNQFGCSGLSVYDYVLNEIYRVKGCYLEWDANTTFDVADYFRIKESLVNEIISYCCSLGLFDKELRANESVLSSKSIQLRYKKICTKAGRKEFAIPSRVELTNLITELIDPETKLISKETELLTQESTQRKGKESKININIYSEEDLLKTWAEARMHWDKVPTNISKLTHQEKMNFNVLAKTYAEKEFRDAMNGLFFQGSLPKVRLRPTWLLDLKNFEEMRECWLSKKKVFGELKTRN